MKYKDEEQSFIVACLFVFNLFTMRVIVLRLKQIDENHNKLRRIFCKPCHCAKLQTKVGTPEKLADFYPSTREEETMSSLLTWFE